MTNETIFIGDPWVHSRTGEQFRIETFSETRGSVGLRNDRRSLNITEGVLRNLYEYDDTRPQNEVAADPDEPTPEAEPIVIGTAEGQRIAGPDPDAVPNYFKAEKSKSGRKRLTDVARYPNGRIRRERYDFLNSQDTLYGKEKTT